MTDQALEIMPLSAGDHADVLAIYNHYIESSHCTFDTQPFSMAGRIPWFAQFEQPIYHCVVAHAAGRTVGYACSVPFKQKPAYRTSVEVSIYTAPDHHTRGIGSQLYTALFAYLNKQPLHRAYAGIALPNDASVALHEKFSFVQAAHFHEVGYKFGQYWDVVWYERGLGAS